MTDSLAVDFYTQRLSSVDGKSRIWHFAFTPLMVRCVVLNPSWTAPSLFLLNIYLKGSLFFPFGEMVGKVSFAITSAFERIKLFPGALGLCVHLG